MTVANTCPLVAPTQRIRASCRERWETRIEKVLAMTISETNREMTPKASTAFLIEDAPAPSWSTWWRISSAPVRTSAPIDSTESSWLTEDLRACGSPP